MTQFHGRGKGFLGMQVFGKPLGEFQAQPKWRQMQAKKAVGLF